jgi:predicted methyltransferase
MMNCTTILLTLFLTGGCNESAGIDSAVAEAVAHPDRLAEDKIADGHRKPQDILSFFEIKPGMTVLDLFSGGGYYTEMLAHIVTDEGLVYAHNNQAYLDYAAKSLEQRFADGRLNKVKRINAQANDLELPDASLDAVMMVLTYHDFYYIDSANGWPKIDTQDLLSRLCSAMKPGAILGVVDHQASTGSGSSSAQSLHRIESDYVKTELEQSCFEFSDQSNVLANPEDDYGQFMGAAGIKSKTDRFVFKFRRK